MTRQVLAQDSQANTPEGLLISGLLKGNSTSLYQWNLQGYQKHWLEAIRRIVDGEASSVLVTSLPKLTRRNLIGTWPMWRFGETVKLQEHLLILPNLNGPFDPADPYVHVGEYNGAMDEEGHRPSKWEVSVSDMAAFLEAQEPRIEIRG